MVLSILKWVGIAMVLSLVALWLWQGGYWKIAKYAEIIPSPLTASSTEALYQLPGQPEFFQVPDTTSDAADMEYGASDYESPQDALYDPNVYGPGQDGERSPYAGFVDLQIGTAQSSNPNEEYIVIRASGLVTLPISVSGWTVRSNFTGARAVVPLAASPFVQGVVNSVRDIQLGSAESVILGTGVSPVGVSFRETTCTGYLAQTQKFTPYLSNACPRPTDLLPATAENTARFGEACVNFVQRLPQCSYPSNPPSDVSNTCRSFLANTFTYSGCMRAYGSGESTNMRSWRAYESSANELWGNEHDTIVLYDGQGRTVTTMSY